jgi:hypothetical protein
MNASQRRTQKRRFPVGMAVTVYVPKRSPYSWSGSVRASGVVADPHLQYLLPLTRTLIEFTDKNGFRYCQAFPSHFVRKAR